MSRELNRTVVIKNNRRLRRRAGVAAIAALSMFSAACSSPEERVQKYYASGQEFLENGEFGKANVQFQNVLKIDETHIPTLLGMAEVAERKQNLKQMFGLYQRIVRLDPNHIHAHVQLGKLYLIGSDETAALESAETALAIDPNSVDAIALKSGVLLRIGDTENAVELARQAIASDPGHIEATTVLATARGIDGDIDGAIAEIERALAVNPKAAVLQLLRIRLLSQLDRLDDVLDGYRQLVDQFPEQTVYRRAFAREFINQKNYDEALDQLEKISELEPENNDIKLDIVRVVNSKDGTQAAQERLRQFVDSEPDNHDLRFALVDLLREQGEMDEAFALIESLRQSDDTAVASRVKNKLALLHLLNGERDKAQLLVDEILEADGNNTDALIKRASFQIDDANFEAGIADLRTALNNNPDSVEAMILMSSAFERQGNIDFARAELAKAFEAGGKQANVANAYAKFLLRNGNSRRAEDVLVQSLAVAPGNMDNLKLLAGVRLDLQDWQGADEIAELIEEIDAGGDGQIAGNIRVVALSGLGEYEQIIDMLSAQREQGPLDSQPLSTLVAAYLKVDRVRDAEEMLKNVLASDPDNYEARILLAQTYFADRKQPEAEAVLVEAANTTPSRGEAFEFLYRYYIARGERDKAIVLVEDGMSKAPDNDALLFFKGDILIAAGELEEALDVYAGLLEKRPNDRIVANNFVSISSDLRTDEASIARALEVAKILEEDENALVRDTVGWAHYRAGQYSRAVEFLSEAAQSAGGNAEILYHLGAAQIAAGDVESGQGNLNKALEAGGENFRYNAEVQSLLNQ